MSNPNHSHIGNAWAAAGMIRVLGTIKGSEYADSFQSQQTNLTNWVQEIHGGMYPLLVRLISAPCMEVLSNR